MQNIILIICCNNNSVTVCTVYRRYYSKYNNKHQLRRLNTAFERQNYSTFVITTNEYLVVTVFHDLV
jgi:hypothetical protein